MADKQSMTTDKEKGDDEDVLNFESSAASFKEGEDSGEEELGEDEDNIGLAHTAWEGAEEKDGKTQPPSPPSSSSCSSSYLSTRLSTHIHVLEKEKKPNTQPSAEEQHHSPDILPIVIEE